MGTDLLECLVKQADLGEEERLDLYGISLLDPYDFRYTGQSDHLLFHSILQDVMHS
jgi:hypothetical protein